MVDRTLRRVFILAGIALLLWILYLLKPVVIPFVAAFLMAYLFSPLVDKLHDIGLPRWLSISIVFTGIGIVMILAIWYLVPLIWQQLIYARDNIPAVIGWINSTFCHGCRIPSMSLKWKLIPHRFLMWSWTMCKPIIVLTVFRPSCYALHNLELTFADWRYDCPDSNYCILFPAGLGSYARKLASPDSTSL